MPKKKKKISVADALGTGNAYAFKIEGVAVSIVGPPDLRPRHTSFKKTDVMKAVTDGTLEKTMWKLYDHTGKEWPIEVYAVPQGWLHS